MYVELKKDLDQFGKVKSKYHDIFSKYEEKHRKLIEKRAEKECKDIEKMEKDLSNLSKKTRDPQKVFEDVYAKSVKESSEVKAHYIQNL